MAMTKDCLTKLKPILSDEVFEKLDEAFVAGDQKTWDFTMQESHADMQLLRRSAIRDANVRESMITYIKGQEKFGIKPEEALLDMISGSSIRQKSGIVSLERKIEQIRGYYSAMNIDMIDGTRATLMGLRRAGNPEFIRGFVKGLFGDPDAAISKDGQALIDSWTKTIKALRERHTAAGGNIQELKEYFIPVNHSVPYLLKKGEDAWVAEAPTYLNLRRKPGMKEISDEDLYRVSFRSITGEGDDLDFGSGVGKNSNQSKIGNAHQKWRTLQPKDGSAWLGYTEKYGIHSNPADAMKEYIDSMSTEIGLMEVLGTNPHKMVKDMAEELKRTTNNPRAGDLSIATLDKIRSRAPRVNDTITNTFRGLRAIQTIVKLPLAGITAMNDAAHMTTRSLYLGMNPVKVFTRHMKNLVTSGDYKTAGKLGLLTDYANQLAVGANRYMESTGFSKLERVADFSMRANGLNHWTNSAKGTFGMEMLSFLSDNAAKDIGAMPKGLKRAFERYGISDADWSTIRKSTTNIKGTDFLDPTSDMLNNDLKAKVVGMIKEETGWVVPEPNAKTRAIASGGAQENTILSEVVKTGMQFKTFGVSMMVSNIGMMLDKTLPTPTKMAYASSLIATSTVMGVITSQLMDIAKGRTPRELDGQLIAEGAMRGNVLGIWADMFFKDPRTFGGLPAQIAGPTVGDMNRIGKVIFNTKDEMFKDGGKPISTVLTAVEQAAEEAAFFLRIAPLRVAAERGMFQFAQQAVNPDYWSKQKRTKKWLREERGQGYWYDK